VVHPAAHGLLEGVRDPTRKVEEFDGWTCFLKGGITSILEAMVTQGGFVVHFNRKVTKVRRNKGSFKVNFEEVRYDENGARSVFRGVESFKTVVSGMSSQEFVNIYNKGYKIRQSLCVAMPASGW